MTETKTASQLFEEIGFRGVTLVRKGFGCTGFVYYGTYKGQGEAEVFFNDTYEAYSVEGIAFIGADLHRAITKQLEELKWNQN